VKAPRVGLVGARRRRQGLGPFVARDLVAAGAEVACFVATSEASREAALPDLRSFAGLSPRGYLDLREMLAAESLDALAILSPPECHAGHLELAAEAGVHVLCEKPFVWEVDDPRSRTATLLEAFAERRRIVWENCQWPYTLAGFEALHPGGLATPPRRFEMELEPISRGLRMLGDALPHPISLLQRLCPGTAPRAEGVRVEREGPGAGLTTIRFDYETDSWGCQVQVRLRRRESGLRAAAYAIDGRRARRVVSPDGYRLSFADSDRSVPIADPLSELVADFVEALRASGSGQGSAPPQAREIQERMDLLVALTTAYEESP
jgi:predicted dehydrogenase